MALDYKTVKADLIAKGLADEELVAFGQMSALGHTLVVQLVEQSQVQQRRNTQSSMVTKLQ